MSAEKSIRLQPTHRDAVAFLSNIIRKGSKLGKIEELIRTGEVQYAHYLMQNLALREYEVTESVSKGLEQLISEGHIEKASLAMHMFNINATYNENSMYILKGIEKLILEGDFENAAKASHKFHISWMQIQPLILDLTTRFIDSNELVKAAHVVDNFRVDTKFKQEFSSKLTEPIIKLIDKGEVIDAAFIVDVFELKHEPFDFLKPNIINYLRHLMINDLPTHMSSIAKVFRLTKDECSQFRPYIIEKAGEYIKNGGTSFAVSILASFKIKKSDVKDTVLASIKKLIHSNKFDFAHNAAVNFFITEPEIKPYILANIEKQLIANNYENACKLAATFHISPEEASQFKKLVLDSINVLLINLKIHDAANLAVMFYIDENDLKDEIKQ